MDTFLGYKVTTTNKPNKCFWCFSTIKTWTKTRHDIWKVGKSVENRYYCECCETIFETQSFLKNEVINKKWESKIVPMNLVKWELRMRYPFMYKCNFKKYDSKHRIKILSDLFELYTSWFFPILWYKIWWYTWFWKQRSFTMFDFEEFSEIYEKEKQFIFYIFNNTTDEKM